MYPYRTSRWWYLRMCELWNRNILDIDINRKTMWFLWMKIKFSIILTWYGDYNVSKLIYMVRIYTWVMNWSIVIKITWFIYEIHVLKNLENKSRKFILVFVIEHWVLCHYILNFLCLFHFDIVILHKHLNFWDKLASSTLFMCWFFVYLCVFVLCKFCVYIVLQLNWMYSLHLCWHVHTSQLIIVHIYIKPVTFIRFIYLIKCVYKIFGIIFLWIWK